MSKLDLLRGFLLANAALLLPSQHRTNVVHVVHHICLMFNHFPKGHVKSLHVKFNAKLSQLYAYFGRFISGWHNSLASRCLMWKYVYPFRDFATSCWNWIANLDWNFPESISWLWQIPRFWLISKLDFRNFLRQLCDFGHGGYLMSHFLTTELILDLIFVKKCEISIFLLRPILVLMF